MKVAFLRAGQQFYSLFLRKITFLGKCILSWYFHTVGHIKKGSKLQKKHKTLKMWGGGGRDGVRIQLGRKYTPLQKNAQRKHRIVQWRLLSINTWSCRVHSLILTLVLLLGRSFCSGPLQVLMVSKSRWRNRWGWCHWNWLSIGEASGRWGLGWAWSGQGWWLGRSWW